MTHKESDGRQNDGTRPLPSTDTDNADENVNPLDLVEPENALPDIALADLPAVAQKAAASAGWSNLMPVQAKAIPYLLAGRDLMVQSRTGSGKTGAFLLPLLHQIRLDRRVCQALILVPTRELALQVSKEAALLGEVAGVSSVAVYGGVKYGPQTSALREGAQMVIGTPGRILDHLLQRNLRLDDLHHLVFDEADRMLSMGFYPDMLQVQTFLPSRRIHGSMFSATFPAHVLRLAQQFLTEPDFLSLSRDRVHVAEAEHILYADPGMKKDRALVRLIEVENPAAAIVFCNTRRTVDYVTIVLQRFGYDADKISSDLNQNERERVMRRVREGKLRLLVATDVAARGIDIPELSHVFQYEPPEDPESYIHRAGRTARAGASGAAISLTASFDERMLMERIAKRYTIPLEERKLPSDDEVAATVSERVTSLLEAKLRGRDNLQTERMRRFRPLIDEWMESDEGQTLLAMLVDDFYQESLHAPPALPEERPTERPPRQGRKRSRSGRTRRPRNRRN
ncbi:MAG: DEAD/DEAH box helicase [Caldilineaceae bacterium SB0675_bin_29]|uniref:DEAD/DEAH box helicase n=1 Tax=Caldilineaceae bacterium SB0675_bin_29 TaxID=2605266 RepID=A0A6B1FXP0_9CHLR|nr:DEAD/DEAH box helicase [Caldilineaceae bacterium SB0675_bin_29]